MLDPNPSINELRRLIPTIGMERDTRDNSFRKVIHSPADSTSQSTGVETNSETSLRSPSGLSSLPSIGSPSSVTSPQTCAPSSYYESSTTTNLLSSSGCNDWFRQNTHAGIGIPSAFKPLTTTSSGVSISPCYRVTASPKLFEGPSDSTINHCRFSSRDGITNSFNSAGLNAGIMNSMNSISNSVINNQSQNIRTRVGADPRDAKNPLSISQLTGNINANNQLHENRKDFMSSDGRVLINGLTDISGTSSRDNDPLSSSTSEKLDRRLPAEHISSLIV